jgi:transposase
MHMIVEEKRRTLCVGVDVHKDTHTAVGLSPFGEKVFEMTISNEERDFEQLVTRALAESKKYGLKLQFGLEDVHSWGERLSTFLVEEGISVCAVAPVLVDRVRKTQTHPEKNDSLDARGVAEVMLRKSDTLPSYTLTEDAKKAKQIRELSVEREFLVKDRTRLKNQLHILLHRAHNTQYRAVYKDPFSKKALAYWMANIPQADTILASRITRAVKRLQQLREEVSEIEKELRVLVEASGHMLHTASGCGIVIAADIIGEVADVSRFKTPGALAKYAGCAPRECSSGKTVRFRKSYSGNRRLNRALHRMALAQISRMGNERARAYFKKKIAEGKSKMQALVCLRRQLVNVVWMMLKYKTAYTYPQTSK